MAFTIEERQVLGIHGLLPARVKTQEEQVQLCKISIERYEDPLNKYIYLMGLLVSMCCFVESSTYSFRRLSERNGK
jgi:hypothetical protein